MKADLVPVDWCQPEWSCDSVPIPTTRTSHTRRTSLTSLIADAKRKMKVHTARPPGCCSKADENLATNNHELMTSSPKVGLDDSPNAVHSKIAADEDDDEVPGLSDDEDMPGLVRPDAESEDEESIYNGGAADSDDGESSEHDEAQRAILADTYARLVSIVQDMSRESRTMPRST